MPGTAGAAPSTGFSAAVNTQVAAARRLAPQLGVHVIAVESGETAYAFHADELRILASNTKLFTTAAALDRLGPGFFFETELLVRGEVADGTLKGPLAVVGGGDPTLSGRLYDGDSFGAFREWAAALHGSGIERLAGGLVLVDGLFEAPRIHPDWPEDQLDRWYEAPVAALSFNDNCVLLRVSPDGVRGGAATVEVEPALPIFAVESSARTVRGASSLRFGRRLGEPLVLTVSGRVRPGAESIDRWVAVADPVRYFGTALRAALAEEGIEVGGEVVAQRQLPGPGWRHLLTHRTDLLTALEVINKRSQNFFAESLLKLLGARLCGDGSWAGGVKAVREFLDEVGLDPEGYRLADGSGMSRRNRATPRQVTTLLRAMAHHRWGKEFLRTLPYSGELDLKWEDRLAVPPYRGNVLAKTGTLDGVSTLSGYVKARSGTLYAFSILMNATPAIHRAQAAQDAILRAVVERG